MKVLFIPVGVITGIAGGLAAQKIFERLWMVADKAEPPDPKHRDVHYPKLISALLLEGAVFRCTRGLVDHASRRGFARVTGAWPGEPAPKPR